MSLESFIEHYGYLALVVGTFLEGETILVLGGFLAHRGYLELPFVILSALAGSLLGDQLFFIIGRVKGRPFLYKRPRWRFRTERVQSMLERHDSLLILGFRFFYGMRTVTPFAIGATGIKAGKFLVLNAIGAFLWSVAIGLCGYLFGTALEAVISDIKRYEALAMLSVASLGLVVWLFHFYRTRRPEK